MNLTHPRDIATFATFAANNAAEAQWLMDNHERSDFARSLLRGLLQWGNLTPRQLAAVTKCAAPRPAALAVQDDALRQCFERATAKGLKRPVLRLDSIKVSPAPATGKNPGALYVKAVDAEGTYLGKVMGGSFTRSFACSDDQAAQVASLMSDPAKALDAYGRRTGNCGCCGRPLTAAESVERGIGPICAEKFGL
jgi:hypothetical protein